MTSPHRHDEPAQDHGREHAHGAEHAHGPEHAHGRGHGEASATAPRAPAATSASTRRLAASATTHCLTGCGIGEVLGLVLAKWWGWGDVAAIALAVALAFVFGYSLTLIPLVRAGLALATAAGIALAADSLSITVMEIVDNAILLVIPGAMDAGLGSLLFWGSLAFALAVAWIAAFPVNYWLLTRGRGHALVHEHHAH